jgi:hypothetical protein
MKAFDNEWIFGAFEQHRSFFTRRMFGGLAAYLFGRQMMVLVEPTKTGRWKWHGVLVCTAHEHQPSIVKEFRHLAPHDVLKKWRIWLARGSSSNRGAAEARRIWQRGDGCDRRDSWRVRPGLWPGQRIERCGHSQTPRVL